MANTTLSLDAERLLDQIQSLGTIGVDALAGGRTRIALSDDEKAGRDRVVQWMRALQLDVRIDRIGNIFGFLRAQRGCPRWMLRRACGLGSRARLSGSRRAAFPRDHRRCIHQ